MPEAFPFLRKEDTRRINSAILEGLFFHRGDNPPLYTILFEHREKFADFWQEHFGIELVVRQDVAYRRHDNRGDDPFSSFTNTNIPNDARLHLYWSGRQNGRLCLLIFARFLYWYETTVRKSAPKPYGEFFFNSHEFFTWANQEIAKFFDGKPGAPTPDQFHAAHRTVMADLVRYGFLRVEETRQVEGEELERLRATQYRDEELVTYAARPGLTAYDPFILDRDPTTFRRAYGHEPDAETPAQEEDVPT